SWRVVVLAAAGLLVLAAAFLHLAVPERAETASGQTLGRLAAGFRVVFATPTFWRLGLMMAVMSGVHAAVQGLWIGPWLRDVGGYGRADTIVLLTTLMATAAVGCAVAGWACDVFLRRGVRALTLYKVQSAVILALFG